MNVLKFSDALQLASAYDKKNLLLGNGFSIACVPSIFTYTSLFQQADFSAMPEVREVFENLKTKDFEEVIRSLEYSSLVLPAYKKDIPQTITLIEEHAKQLKELLIKTIAQNHPPRPNAIDERKYRACVHFLNNFLEKDGVIYSLNYDLLLYWTLMFGKNEGLLITEPNDGFGKDVDFDDGEASFSDYVIWQGDSNAHGQNIHYLHGALHIFEKGPFVEKFTWSNTGVPLIDQAREALNENRFPLFVYEGDSNKKLSRITHSGYLYHSYKSFSVRMKLGNPKSRGKKTTSCLFIYGLSFSENDSHIVKKITNGWVNHLFISLYGDPGSETNKAIIETIEGIRRKSRNPNLQISYFDAESAEVWG